MPVDAKATERILAQAKVTIEFLAAELDSGRVTSRGLVEEALARIADPEGEGARSFRRVYDVSARDAADAQDKLRKAGYRPSPLAGLPVSVKDLFDVAGERTLAGSKALDDAPPAAGDAAIVARLKAAGAVILGSTNMTEFAFSGVGINPHYGTPGNPWDRSRIPGGSSSGAAVAVADGQGVVAIGTDTGGSVRNPASACGIVGLKPTYGLVSRRGVFPLSFTLDHVGPLARSVADIALMLDATAAHDPDDPGSAPTNARYFGRMLDRGVCDLRIGFVRHFHETDMPAHPETAAALEEAARVLGQGWAGALRRITLPLTLPGIGAAMALVFTATVSELTATLLLLPLGENTLTSRVWQDISTLAFASAAPFAAVLMVLSAAGSWLAVRRFGEAAVGRSG